MNAFAHPLAPIHHSSSYYGWFRCDCLWCAAMRTARSVPNTIWNPMNPPQHGITLPPPKTLKDTLPPPADTAEVLDERQRQYGDFASRCAITQALKRAMTDTPNWSRLSDAQREALEQIATKIGRLLNGDPNHRDSWQDIAGYAIEALKTQQ